MKQARASASARAFLNCPFDLLVDMLSLEPKDDWHLWLDPEGNRLRLLKSRAVIAYPAATKVQRTKDIFRKAHPSLIVRHSYWGVLISGQTHQILLLLGNDGKLRCSYFKDGIWIENISPVLLGFDILRYIVSGYLEPKSRIIKSPNIKYVKNLGIEESWAFGLPIEDDINLKERVDRCLQKTQNSME